jgi:hypothetical protein
MCVGGSGYMVPRVKKKKKKKKKKKHTHTQFLAYLSGSKRCSRVAFKINASTTNLNT